MCESGNVNVETLPSLKRFRGLATVNPLVSKIVDYNGSFKYFEEDYRSYHTCGVGQIAKVFFTQTIFTDAKIRKSLELTAFNFFYTLF
jgi:hypothetical protein